MNSNPQNFVSSLFSSSCHLLQKLLLRKTPRGKIGWGYGNIKSRWRYGRKFVSWHPATRAHRKLWANMKISTRGFANDPRQRPNQHERLRGINGMAIEEDRLLSWVRALHLLIILPTKSLTLLPTEISDNYISSFSAKEYHVSPWLNVIVSQL